MSRLLVVTLTAIMLSGCASAPQRDRNALFGAGVGAGIGALIGSASGGPPAMWAGAAIGAASGGVIGYFVRNDACYFRNRAGEIWQIPCESLPVGAHACFVGGVPDRLTPIDCRNR